jgi:hypothetical protein
MRQFVLTVCLASLTLPAFGAPVLDGIRDADYGAPLAIQTVQSGFSASRLDAGYGRIEGGKLYLMLTGKLDDFRSILEIFIDSKPGGQNVFQSPHPSGPVAMNGLVFDNLFGADYHVFARRGPVMANDSFDLDFADLGTQAFSSYSDLFGGLDGVANTPTGVNLQPIGVAYNDSNVAGVGHDAPNLPIPLDAGANATAGLELVFDLDDLGYTGGVIRVMAGLNGQGHGFWSNQFLQGIAPQGNIGGDGMGGFTGSGAIDMTTFAGNQFFTVAPESRVVPEPATIVFAILLGAFALPRLKTNGRETKT